MTPSDRPPATLREGGRRSLGGDGAVNASLPFQVDPLSGEVTLAAAVDRETKDQYHMVGGEGKGNESKWWLGRREFKNIEDGLGSREFYTFIFLRCRHRRKATYT